MQTSNVHRDLNTGHFRYSDSHCFVFTLSGLVLRHIQRREVQQAHATRQARRTTAPNRRLVLPHLRLILQHHQLTLQHRKLTLQHRILTGK